MQTTYLKNFFILTALTSLTACGGEVAQKVVQCQVKKLLLDLLSTDTFEEQQYS